MNQLKTTDLGGFPIKLDDLRFMTNAFKDAIRGILSPFDITDSKCYILSGCQTIGMDVQSGYVSIGGELCFFPGQNLSGMLVPYWTIDSSFDPNGTKNFQNGSVYETHEVRVAKLVNSGSTVAPPGHTLLTQTKRINQLIREMVNSSIFVNLTDAGTDYSALTAKCLIDIDGFVRTSGQSIFEDIVTAASKIVCIYPLGYRPPVDLEFFMTVKNSGVIIPKKCLIKTNGEFIVYDVTAGPLEINLVNTPLFRV